MNLDPLLYDVQYDADTGEMSFYDKSGGLIYSCVVETGIDDDISKPLMFKAAADNSSVALSKKGDVTNTYETSVDGVTWETYELTTDGVVVPLNRGEEIYFRCSNWVDTFSLDKNVRFKMSGEIKAYHNCASMLGAEMPNTPPTWGFGLLFYTCASLIKAPLLGVSSYSSYCFRSMFSGTGIIYPPALPKNTPYMSSCEYMFSGCSNLVEAPKLEALDLRNQIGKRCFAYMFRDCTSLTVAPELPFTELSDYCYERMFQGCSNLTTPPSILPSRKAPTASSCVGAYSYMFIGCKNLSRAPSFGEWTDVANSLCKGMFSGCSSLVEPPVFPTGGRAYISDFEEMFKGCTSLVHPPELPYINTFENCYKSMFEGCTSLVETPDLPATSISSDAYYRMFYGCSSLSKVVCRAVRGMNSSGATNTGNTDMWLWGVSPTGDFYADPTAPWKVGVYGIPSGWNRIDIAELEV